jgi:Enoyl-CoA hydratase/isomerase
MIELVREGSLAVATLARAPVNAISEDWLARLEEILGELQDTTVLLLRSSQKAFCAGADLELMRSRFDSAEGRRRMVEFVRRIQRVLARLERLAPRPWAAASSSRSPATSGLPPRTRASACPSRAWASYRARAARSACRASPGRRSRSASSSAPK